MSNIEGKKETGSVDQFVHTEILATDKVELNDHDIADLMDLFVGGEIDKQFRQRNGKDSNGRFKPGVKGEMETREIAKGVLEVSFIYYKED